MSNVEIMPSEMPESSIDGKYNVRYRLVTEDRNQTSSYSDVKTLTLPQVTVQVGSSNTGLVMSAVRVADTIVLSTVAPTTSSNKLTFSWTPGDGITLDRSEYDLYAYFTDQDPDFQDFDYVSPIFLGTVNSTGTYVVDPTAFSTRNEGFLLVIFEPKYVVFVLTKKTNIKSIYNFKLKSKGDGITDSLGAEITTHNIVTFVSPRFRI